MPESNWPDVLFPKQAALLAPNLRLGCTIVSGTATLCRSWGNRTLCRRVLEAPAATYHSTTYLRFKPSCLNFVFLLNVASLGIEPTSPWVLQTHVQTTYTRKPNTTKITRSSFYYTRPWFWIRRISQGHTMKDLTISRCVAPGEGLEPPNHLGNNQAACLLCLSWNTILNIV